MTIFSEKQSGPLCPPWIFKLRLRINYRKSKVIVFYVDQEEQERVAILFNCEVRVSLIKYLEIPVSFKKLIASNFESWPIKIHSEKVGELATYFDRWPFYAHCSCLDNTHNHILGFYPLPENIHYQAYVIMDNFSSEGNGGTSKYHMVRWSSLCRPQHTWVVWALWIAGSECFSLS